MNMAEAMSADMDLTAQQIVAGLEAVGIDPGLITTTHDSAIMCPALTIYLDTSDPTNSGWAYRLATEYDAYFDQWLGDESGAIDNLADVKRMARCARAVAQ